MYIVGSFTIYRKGNEENKKNKTNQNNKGMAKNDRKRNIFVAQR